MKWWIGTSPKLWELEKSQVQEMEQWVKEHVGKRYTISAGRFHFRTKAHAAWFELKWA
jgi:hypothetical protein